MTTTVVLDENTLFQQTSQSRLWTFTPSTLAQMRAGATASAITHLTTTLSSSQTASLSPLTPPEELEYLNMTTIPLLSDIIQTYFLSLPRADRIRSTAAQYLRRYFTAHSAMETPAIFLSDEQLKLKDEDFPGTPLLQVLAALYLATKVHDEYIALADFVGRIREKGKRAGLEGWKVVDVESVKRAEAYLTRSLRFAFEIRVAGGEAVKGLELVLRQAVKNGILEANDTDGLVEEVERVLDVAARLTDVYFLYSPGQVMLAAVLVASKRDSDAVSRWIFETVLGSSSAQTETHGTSSPSEQTKQHILACADLLRKGLTPNKPSSETKSLQQRIKHIWSSLLATSTPSDTALDTSTSADKATDGPNLKKRNGKGNAHGLDAGFSSDDDDNNGTVVNGDGESARKKRRLQDDDVFGGPLLGKG